MADASLPARLQEQRKAAVLELQERLSTWEVFQNDYKSLEETLKILPGKISHEIMVPFGSLAFMPGKLIHTNEILVLLGDNWFAERSASQAIEIVKRRQQSIDENIKLVNTELEVLSSQLNLVQELGDLDKDQDGMVEIKEEIKEDDGVKVSGKGPRIARTKAKEFAPKQVKRIDPHSIQDNMSQEDQELFSKLDKLEDVERINKELSNEQSQTLYNKVKNRTNTTVKERYRNRECAKHSEVHFSDELNTASKDSDDSDDYEDSYTTRTIMVNFTKPQSEAPSKSPSAKDTINMPTDIYTKIKQKPKSILRTPSFELKTQESRTLSTTQTTQQQALNTEQQEKPSTPFSQREEDLNISKAFSGTIIDRTTRQVSIPKTTTSEPKRVSKFKAQRNK